MARLGKPTPRFFKSLRNIGLAVGAVGTALITAPVVLPAAVVTLGGYLVVSGSVMGIVAQTATEKNHLQKRVNGKFSKGYIFED